MLDVNMMIASNIQAVMKKQNKKQIDLAENMGVSKQTMSKIMNGARAINAIELWQIAEYLSVPMDTLVKVQEKMILFHTRVYQNGQKMERPWEEE